MTQVASNPHRVEVIAAPSGNSALAVLVQSLTTSGQRWGSFTKGSGWNNGDVFRCLAPGGPGGSAMQYTDRMSWNPVNKTVLFLGGVHFTAQIFYPVNSGNAFVRWRDVDNTWTNAMPPVSPNFDNAKWWSVPAPGDPGIGIGHSYQHDCIDTTTGDYYHRTYGQNRWSRFTHSTQTWSNRTDKPSQSQQDAGASDYFPERHSCIFVDGDWGVWEFDIATETWALRAGTSGGGFPPNLPMGSYHNMCRYVPGTTPGTGSVFFGSGQGNLNVYRYSAAGAFTQIQNAPFDVGVIRDGNGTGAITATNSRTGEMLCWRALDGACWKYSPSANQWSAVPAFNHPMGFMFVCVAVTIPDYHCILFAAANDQQGSLNRLDVLRL